MPIELSPETFEPQVLEASRLRPVIVDFWAPWCAPCVQLAPILEELERASGRFTLAKLDVERHPELGQRFGVSSIPALKAFRDGQVVSESAGLLTKAQLEDWLKSFVPGEEQDQLETARRLEAAGDQPGAEAAYRRALEAKPGFEDARLGLAALLAQGSLLEEAESLVEELEGEIPARIRLRRAAEGGPDLEAARRAAADGSVENLYQKGLAEALHGERRAALEAFLEVVRRDRSFRDDAGRRMMLEIFQLDGDAELVEDFRRRLALLLF